jgi:hypothetical protein
MAIRDGIEGAGIDTDVHRRWVSGRGTMNFDKEVSP